MAPTYAWNLRDVGTLMKQLEGALEGVPPQLFVPAALLMIHLMVTGKTLNEEEAPKFVGDVLGLVQAWKVEVYQ